MAVVAHRSEAGMRWPLKRASSTQGTEGADGHAGKGRIVRGLQRVGSEGSLNHSVQVGISRAQKQVFEYSVFRLAFNALSPECLRVQIEVPGVVTWLSSACCSLGLNCGSSNGTSVAGTGSICLPNWLWK